MKKLLSIVLAFVVVFSCFCVVPASAATSKIIEIDGIRQSYGASTVIQDGRTLVPMRGIFESLGAEVEWDEATKTVTGKTKDVEVVLTIDSNKATVNGEEKTLDVPAQLIDSSTFVPARFVAEALNCDVDFTSDQFFSKVLITTGKTYKSTEPQTPAESAVVKRARQLSEFTWTPKNVIPTRQSSVMKAFEPGTEYKGIIYSSTLVNDKTVGNNVSFYTYMTALANPDSVIYTKQLSSMANADCFYGMVCNGLVRYALGIKEEFNVANIPTIPGMKKVGEAGKYTVDDIKICDVLLKIGSHVAIVTDVLRDDDGNIVAIEICDETRPVARRTVFSVDYFYSGWGNSYDLYRYDYLQDVPLFDEEERKLLFESNIDEILPMIAVDYGDKSNYIVGEETVISVFAEGDNVVEIYKNGELLNETAVSGRAKFARKLGAGYYEVKLKGTDYSTQFCVTNPEVSYTVADGKVTITAKSNDEKSTLFYIEYRNANTWAVKGISNLTEEEIKSGVITREIPTDYPVAFKVFFKNEYGIWTHLQIDIEQ